MEVTDLPALNSFFNLVATFCLVSGYVAIKKKQEETHKKWMISAFIASTFFLICYLIYHYHVGSVAFPEVGLVKTLYLIILIPHIILATLMVPMILLTFFHAFKDNREKHKRIAKITLPIWLYVSVSGIIIYIMLYHIAPILTAV